MTSDDVTINHIVHDQSRMYSNAAVVVVSQYMLFQCIVVVVVFHLHKSM